MLFDYIHAHIPEEFDPEILVRGFETVEKARERRKHRIDVLRRFGRDDEDLIGLLVGCKEHRCESAACPVCLRHFRKWWCSRVTEFMSCREEIVWYSINIVDHRQTYPLGELEKFDPQKMKERLRKQLERSDLSNALVCGGIDVNLTHYEGRAPKWCPHLHLLTSSGAKERIRSALQRHYPNTDDTLRALQIELVKQTIEDRARVCTYSFKATFDERAPAHRGEAYYRKTYPPVPDEYMPELCRALNAWGFGKRLIRRGYSDFLPEMRAR